MEGRRAGKYDIIAFAWSGAMFFIIVEVLRQAYDTPVLIGYSLSHCCGGASCYWALVIKVVSINTIYSNTWRQSIHIECYSVERVAALCLYAQRGHA